MDLDASERFSLISDNLAEILDPQIIENILAEKRNPRVYWGTATTGRPHTGYYVPALKIAQLLAAGCEVVVLLADIHGFLDNLKAPLELVDSRAAWYRWVITAILESVGVSIEKLHFVLGTSYQKSADYVMDVYRLSSLISEHDAKRAGAEIVKKSENAPLSGLLYPILQVLDEEHLHVDAQLGESSDSKIDLLDSPEDISKKIRKAVAVPKVTDENGVLALAEFILLPAAALKGRKEFRVERKDGSEPLIYTNIQQMHDDYRNDVLTPQMLKPAVSAALSSLMEPIRAAYQASDEWQQLTLKAYPPPEKKKAKIKDKGTLFPGKQVGGDVGS
ncbi:MAG: hypothetical protein M1821_003757 [Bathelium mastoideum]|nr:MAG: hypothetical protein M1821_003757 [Bathelium mastoideum]